MSSPPGLRHALVVLAAACLVSCGPWPSTRGGQAWQPASEATFRDVSALAGLDQLPAPSGSCAPEPSSPTAGSRPDPSSTNPASSGSGDGSAAVDRCFVKQLAGGVAVGDLVGDPLADIVVSSLTGPPRLLRNDGGFHFSDVSSSSGFTTAEQPTNGVAVADIDNDGDRDVFLTTLGGDRATLLVNNGDGTFGEEAVARGAALDDGTSHAGTGAVFADIDNDGWVDLHVTEFQPDAPSPDVSVSHVRLLRNRGAAGLPGVFEDITEKAGVSLERPGRRVLAVSSRWEDLDRDDRLDLIVAAPDEIRVFAQEPAGSFRERIHALGPATGLSGGDLDGDGRPELLLADPGVCAGSTLGNRLVGFTPGGGAYDLTDRSGLGDTRSSAAIVADLTNSGTLDLITVTRPPAAEPGAACSTGSSLEIWRNDGSALFVNASVAAGFPPGLEATGVVAFDADLDGRLDLLVTRSGRPPALYANTTSDPGDWVAFLFNGADVAGAQVTVTPVAGGPALTRSSGPAGSFPATGQPLVHVGLGDHRGRLARVEVTFASGARTVLGDVATGQVIVVQERRS